MTRPFLTVKEVADIFGKSPETIRTWCETGYLPGADQPVKGGHWIIPATALDNRGKTSNPYPTRTARSRAQQRKTR